MRLSHSLFTLALAASACAQGSADGGAMVGSGDAARAIAEADIIQLDGGRLYAMSRSGTLSIVDVSRPGTLAMLGQSELPGEPFEMYRRGDRLVAMINNPDTRSMVLVLDVKSPGNIRIRAALEVAGELADSRIVGDILYLATYEDAACLGCGRLPRTLVTTFRLSAEDVIEQIDQLSFESTAPEAYNLAWGTHWKRSIFVTEERLYIGGHGDIDPDELYEGTANEGIIDVVDITDPSGRLKLGMRLIVAGAILSRWQLDEYQGWLRVISQKGAGRTGNGIGEPEIAIFRVESAERFVPAGSARIPLPRQEGLRTVRFDGDRAYAITYNQTDPLFTIDLSEPSAPRVRGELHMPGFMFYLEPYGDQLIGLGIDRDDPDGSLNVSLFDVRDLDQPTMLSRASFAAATFNEDYQILNTVMAEDQDRIQKAFRVFDDGTVAVPFSSPEGCNDRHSGVQLIDWTGSTLTKRALLPLPGNPRRAFQNGAEVVAVSESHVRSFALGDGREGGVEQTAELTLGGCSNRDPYGDRYGDEFGYYACSAQRAKPVRDDFDLKVAIALFAIAALLFMGKAGRAAIRR